MSVVRLLLLLFVLFPVQIYAQSATLRGLVREAIHGDPLPDVNVYLEGTTLGTATSARGTFELSGIPPGTYTLVVSAVGYHKIRQPVHLSPGEIQYLEFALEPITLMSGEVVITASRRKQLHNQVPVSLFVLTPEAIESRNAFTLDEALRYVPGVQIADNQVNIRGANGYAYGVGSRVLVLIDGVPLLGPDRGDVKFDALPMSQIEQIEVYKGPGSAIYGGNALSGVINLITRDITDSPSMQAYVFGGGYLPVRYATWRNSWEGGHSIRPFGGGSFTYSRKIGENSGFWAHGFFKENTGYLENSAQRTGQISFKAGWQHPSYKMDILGGYTYNRSQVFLFWQSLREALRIARNDFVSGGNDGISEHLSLFPMLQFYPSSSTLYSWKLRFFRTQFKPLDESGNVRPPETHTIAYQVGSDWQAHWSIANRHLITTGITAVWSHARSAFYQGTDAQPVRQQAEGAAFFQLEERFSPLTQLTAGLRLDAYRLDPAHQAVQISPRLGLNHQITEHAWIRAAAGTGFRVPSMAERYINNQEFLPLLPNPDLMPEKSLSVEGGIHYILPLPAQSGLQIETSFFWADYQHLVEPQFQPALNAFRFVNLPRARIWGIEAILQGQWLNQTFSGTLGYTYLNTLNLEDRRPLLYRPEHLLHFNGTGKISSRLEAGIDVRYVSKPRNTAQETLRFVQDADKIVPVKVTDLRITYQTSHMALSALLKNAWEYYYVERPAKLAPPRHFIIQLRITP